MLFYSPNPAFQVICSKTRDIRHPVTGDVIERIPGVWAKFGKLGHEYTFINPETSQMQQGAEIVGHYFDSELEAAQNGWDLETKEMVERGIQRICQTQPDRVWEIVREIPRQPLPWPTYDDFDADRVIEFARAMGLVEEAVLYEQENKQRPAVIDELSQAVPDPVPAPAPEPAKPEPEPAVSGRTITL